MCYREGISQYTEGINNNPNDVLIQFKEKLKMLGKGSNSENKFVITFKRKVMMNILLRFLIYIFEKIGRGLVLRLL